MVLCNASRGWVGVVVSETPCFFTIRSDVRDWIGIYDKRVKKKDGMFLVEDPTRRGLVPFPIPETLIVWRFQK